MAGLVKPILQQIQTDLVNNLNAEVDLLDATMPDIDTDLIFIFAFNDMPSGFPVVDIYPFGDAVVQSEETNVITTIPWQIATRVAVIGDTEAEASEILDNYLTAMSKTIIKQGWGLSGEADIIRLLSWSYTADSADDTTIYKEGLLLWEVEKEYDLSV